METLISMTDFVISQWDKDITREEFTQRVIKYATLLKQPLTLGMFVPCDEYGNVLIEPEFYKIYICDIKHYLNYIECGIYHSAKERVLFADIEAIKCTSYYILKFENKPVYISWNDSKTIEDLITHELKLTETAKKQIYGT